jgi:TolB-like protein
MRASTALVVIGLLAAPLPVVAAVDVPVAVMPFKNLNADPALDWLKAGMAETMVSDLKKGAGLAVVERAQLDHALTELALRGAGGTDEATAAQVGKLTGARTVVLGSFQSAGSQVRIAARFVTVETGVIQDAVKVTGPLDEIFRLQDEVVSKLAGTPAPSPTRPAAKKPRKTGPQVVKAYRLYAMRLATSNDAEKVGYLRDALKEDAEFTYAADDLAALESRMKDYDEAAERARQEHETKERSALHLEGDTPAQRTQHAYQLLASEMSTLRYRQLLGDATAIYAMKLGPATAGAIDAHSFAAYAIFFAHQMLKQRDLALQVGEQFLKNFPDSPYYRGVEAQMNQIIREKREMEEGVAEADAELAKLSAEKADVLAHPPRSGVKPVRLHSLDYQRCIALYRHRQYERAIAECRSYEDQHLGEPESGGVSFVSLCSYHRALSLAELGRFPEARDTVQAVIGRDPAFAKKMSVATVMNAWPKE